MSAMDEWVTGNRCMPNAFHLDPTMLPKVHMAVFTFPCIDVCPLAKDMLGENGTTGWMTATGIAQIISVWHAVGWLPEEVVVVEINGNSLNVNGGAGMHSLVEGLQQHYVVHSHLQRMIEFDPQAPERFIIVALKITQLLRLLMLFRGQSHGIQPLITHGFVIFW